MAVRSTPQTLGGGPGFKPGPSGRDCMKFTIFGTEITLCTRDTSTPKRCQY